MAFWDRYKKEKELLEQKLAEQTLRHEREISQLNQKIIDTEAQLKKEQAVITGLRVFSRTQQRSAEMLELVCNDLLSNANALYQENTDFSIVDEMFRRALTKTTSLQKGAQQISDEANSNHEAVVDLTQTINSISKFVSAVQEISEKTNLLALNAAIEAARAGDAGRGFAVVADEVRQLANKAGEASAQIESLVKKVILQNHQIDKVVVESQKSIGEFIKSSVEINHVMEQIVTKSKNMKSVILDSANAAFINTVKLDHAVWKNALYKAISRKESDQKIDRHTECRLGLWYFDKAMHQNHAACPSFSKLDQPHKLVHDAGRAAYEAWQRNDLVVMNEQLNVMEDASLKVVNILEQLNHEVRKIN
ncbi:MAG: methyl-accepting chemotaxis protein [Enterovibrio sp.]